jgi:hypothetical protein
LSAINAPTLNQIKNAVRNIIATFRGFYTLTDGEVKMEELTTRDNNYITKGRYYFTPLFGSKTEEGTFEITLNNKLETITSKVVPKENSITRNLI